MIGYPHKKCQKTRRLSFTSRRTSVVIYLWRTERLEKHRILYIDSLSQLRILEFSNLLKHPLKKIIFDIESSTKWLKD